MDSTPKSASELDDRITQPPDSVVEAVAACPGDFIIIGAGGKMGFHVGRMLQRAIESAGRDDRVTAVSRFSSPGSREPFERFGFDVVSADTSDQVQLSKLPLSANVIYLAGVKFGTSSSSDLLNRLNVVMPGSVATHFRDSRIVALSTGCVYSFTAPESGGSTEQSEMDPPGDYARSCIGRERAFTEASQKYGTACAIVRLNYSIDLRYGVLVDIAKAVLSGQPVNVDTGHVNVIWQGDAVAHVLACMPHAASPPLVVNVTGAAILSVRELAQRFANKFGCNVSCSGSESETAWLSNPSLSHQMLGPPRVGVDQMIAWIAEWLQHGGTTWDKPTHFQTRDGNY
jgi:nucleoside-diphosphate-sugar epimerase